MVSSPEIYIAECVFHMFGSGTFKPLTDDQITRLELLKKTKIATKTTRVKADKSDKNEEKAADGKRKSTKTEREAFSLPEGTEVFRKLGGVEYVGTWTGATILWEDTEFATPTAFAKAVYYSIHGDDKPHAINGWEACYIKTDEGKHATLKSLRD